jgi:hypothetical protein
MRARYVREMGFEVEAFVISATGIGTSRTYTLRLAGSGAVLRYAPSDEAEIVQLETALGPSMQPIRVMLDHDQITGVASE